MRLLGQYCSVNVCCGRPNTSVELLFADDLKLYSSYNNDDGMMNCQQFVDRLVDWQLKSIKTKIT